MTDEILEQGKKLQSTISLLTASLTKLDSPVYDTAVKKLGVISETHNHLREFLEAEDYTSLSAEVDEIFGAYVAAVNTLKEAVQTEFDELETEQDDE